MTRQYFQYILDGRERVFLLMPGEYELYTNEYWKDQPVLKRFENAAGYKQGISEIRLILELI